MAVGAIGDVLAGRHANLQGDLRCHRRMVGQTADAVRSEVSLSHASFSPKPLLPPGNVGRTTPGRLTDAVTGAGKGSGAGADYTNVPAACEPPIRAFHPLEGRPALAGLRASGPPRPPPKKARAPPGPAIPPGPDGLRRRRARGAAPRLELHR